jgi:hypothetical protein
MGPIKESLDGFLLRRNTSSEVIEMFHLGVRIAPYTQRPESTQNMVVSCKIAAATINLHRSVFCSALYKSC